eukprot:146158-Pyramimonas_sp.AAC.1
MAPPFPVVGCSRLACASAGKVCSPLGAPAPVWFSGLPAVPAPLTPAVSAEVSVGAESSVLPGL